MDSPLGARLRDNRAGVGEEHTAPDDGNEEGEDEDVEDKASSVWSAGGIGRVVVVVVVVTAAAAAAAGMSLLIDLMHALI